MNNSSPEPNHRGSAQPVDNRDRASMSATIDRRGVQAQITPHVVGQLVFKLLSEYPQADPESLLIRVRPPLDGISVVTAVCRIGPPPPGWCSDPEPHAPHRFDGERYECVGRGR